MKGAAAEAAEAVEAAAVAEVVEEAMAAEDTADESGFHREVTGKK